MAYPLATDYFQTLARCMLDTRISDQDGAELSFEEGFSKALDLILKTGERGKVLVVGNGGSAAIASHVHNDLCHSVGVRAMVLTESALLTALTNDHSYAEAYQTQVQMWATSDDLLLAISSSGKSENILRAASAAAAQQCAVITFSGFSPENPLRGMGQLNFYVPANQYGFVEMSHACQLHYLTDLATAQRALWIQSRKSSVSI